VHRTTRVVVPTSGVIDGQSMANVVFDFDLIHMEFGVHHGHLEFSPDIPPDNVSI
jgi:hypothetical protein